MTAIARSTHAWVSGSTTSPSWSLRGKRWPPRGFHMERSISNASGPDRRMIATAPRPAGVAGATMVSSTYMLKSASAIFPRLAFLSSCIGAIVGLYRCCCRCERPAGVASVSRAQNRKASANRRRRFPMRNQFSALRFGATVVFLVSLAGCATMPRPSGNTPDPNLANSGWYLMQPPMSLDAAPSASPKLYDWQEVAYFEKASECDTARQWGLTAYPAELSNLPMSGRPAPNSIEVSGQLASATLCVAANDSRLDRWPVLAKLTSKF